MKVGSKSILFGAHQFLLHPLYVAIAWIKLYGFPWDPRVWIAFFVHDLGYWNKADMDGEDGKTHVELGARIMHWFDGWDYKDITYKIDDWKLLEQEIRFHQEDGWIFIDLLELGSTYNLLFKKRSFKWHDFAMYHSRYYAKKKGVPPSKLCFADKLAFCISIRWLYLIMANASGEIVEYMRQWVYQEDVVDFQKDWYDKATAYNKKWVEAHLDGTEDTWTKKY